MEFCKHLLTELKELSYNINLMDNVIIIQKNIIILENLIKVKDQVKESMKVN